MDLSFSASTLFLGFITSSGAAAIFGVYMIPQKYAGLSPFQFLLSMGTGVLLSTLPLGLWAGSLPLWSDAPRHIATGYFCGFLWCTGTIGYIFAIRGMGLSRATCIKNTTGIWGTVFGISFLGEFSFDAPLLLLCAITGSVLIVYATIIITKTRSQGPDARQSLSLWDVMGALFASISFAALMIPTKQVLLEGLPIERYLFYKGQGAFISILIAFLLFERKSWKQWFLLKPRQHLWAICSGAIWTIGFFLIATGTTLVGLSISWPLNQTSTHFAVLFGVLTKEFDMVKYKGHVYKGLLLTTVGIVLLGISKI